MTQEFLVSLFIGVNLESTKNVFLDVFVCRFFDYTVLSLKPPRESDTEYFLSFNSTVIIMQCVR